MAFAMEIATSDRAPRPKLHTTILKDTEAAREMITTHEVDINETNVVNN